MKLNRYYVDKTKHTDGTWVIRDREHGQQIIERHKTRDEASKRVRYHYHLPGRDDAGPGFDDKSAQETR